MPGLCLFLVRFRKAGCRESTCKGSDCPGRPLFSALEIGPFFCNLQSNLDEVCEEYRSEMFWPTKRQRQRQLQRQIHLENKKRPKRTVNFETFDQGDEETWPDHQKDHNLTKTTTTTMTIRKQPHPRLLWTLILKQGHFHLRQIDISVSDWVGILTHLRKVSSGPVLMPGSL